MISYDIFFDGKQKRGSIDWYLTQAPNVLEHCLRLLGGFCFVKRFSDGYLVKHF